MRKMRDRLCGKVALILACFVAACAQTDRQTEEGATVRTVDGYVQADDGVDLYYRMVGEGPQTVVIPVDVYLFHDLAALAQGRRLVFYDPRNRGRSEAADLSSISLDRQVKDLESLRAQLGIERMALVGWSGLGMEMAVYAMRHPEHVTRLVQVSPVPPAAELMQQAGGDRRAERIDIEAVRSLEARWDAGEFNDAQQEFCRKYNELTLPANFVDASLVSQVPDVCEHQNEWPVNLWPYFGALLGSFEGYDWRADLGKLEMPRLVIHGREDGIPIEGARAWVSGRPSARIVELSPSGHFPFLEQRERFLKIVMRFLDGEWPDEAVAL